MKLPGNVTDCPELRNKVHVFRSREHAGEMLAAILGEFPGRGPVVLAIPAGGIPVAAEAAGRLGLPLDVAVVSKITLPWNTEVGFGAVAFDGTVRINEILAAETRLGEEEVRQGIEATRAKVARRVERLRGKRPFPDLKDRAAIVVDDGLASGFTMWVAVEALRKNGAGYVAVAVPTGHDASVVKLAGHADAVYCLNIRSGWSFAVADAYEHWHDISEKEAQKILDAFRKRKE